jgi:hypothetical protein
MRKGFIIGMAVTAIIVSSLFLVYWYDPGRVIWTKDGTVAAVHHQADSNNGTNWNVLVYIYQQNDMGYLVNTGYVALNGMGIEGHGNYCWNDGNGNCLNSPSSFRLNQTLTVVAMNNGDFMISNRQLWTGFTLRV